MSLPSLYQRSKNNKLKVWSVVVDGDSITVTHGQVDGKLTSKVSPPCKGKNIGKANATTPEEQALLEAKAKWQKQIDRGYSEDRDILTELTLPPLAKKYQDAYKLIDWPWYGSYKLDGIRCTCFYKDGEVVFQSRGGTHYPVITEIADELKDMFFNHCPTLAIDGELYKHGMWLEDITSAVKKHNDNTPKLNFYVFDVVNTEDKASPKLEDRYKAYTKLITAKHSPENRVKAVHQRLIQSDEMFMKMHEVAVELGYEGVVIRNPKSIFKFNYRTADFQKYKVAMSDEFMVAGSELDKNGGGVPVCYLPNMQDIADSYFKEHGKWGDKASGVFRANMAGTHEHRVKIRERLGDKTEEVLHMTVDFESWSKYKVPLKPIGKAFREVQDDGTVCE